ncbi:MAG TPA: ABC transporter ATP-binding protein [Gemmatimonadales bacterium]|nr:ABC transporter ATP-binding protein [Gemmatimonadales bacterium]
MAGVTLREVTRTFERADRAALHALSLAVEDGEFVVLLGPSGCGKTTALRCIAGLEEVTAGEIRIGDRDVTHLPPADRDVAMVFQNYALYPHFSVRGNIAFPLEMRRVPRGDIARRVADAAARLGLSDLLDRRPAELSGGQRQRVALGRAIVREPAVFLFDEPLSNLDAQLRSEMRAELLALHRALRATMIYVTHDQVEAMTMGRRIAVLHEGALRQLGTPREVYEQPADAFVARFVGSPGMNVIGGRGTGDGGGVVAGSLTVPVLAPVPAGDLQVGVRPEHVALVGPGKGQGDAVVRMIEPLGAETLVHLDAGAVRLVARIRGLKGPGTGDLVGVRVDQTRVHLFDATGARLG